MLPKNSNFDYTIGPTLNGHNLVILNPNYTKFMFKLKSMISTFQNPKHPKTHSQSQLSKNPQCMTSMSKS